MQSPDKVVIHPDELKKAFTNNELLLYYQPQFSIYDSSFKGVEALIRWKRGDHLLIPDEFLGSLESAGLVIQLGEWVLHQACLQSREWLDKGLMPIRMAVNVYDENIQSPDFLEKVLTELKTNNLDPKLLEIELTENIIIDTKDSRIQEHVAHLRAKGITIALDDFGTGYSSISHLKKIHIDRIKIDRSYIKDIETSKEDAAIVRAIISLAEGLHIKSLAEGIETLAQLNILMEYGCHEAQGFYLSDPLSAQEAEEFLRLYQSNPFTFKYPG